MAREKGDSSGNFMLQALLALSLVISFLPMFSKKIHGMNEARENAAIAAQLGAAWDAARAFVYEESVDMPDGVKILSGDEFTGRLEPYGLPLGFRPVTPFGTKISLVISKDGNNLLALLIAGRGAINDLRRAEILARVGFWGAVLDEAGVLRGATGGWEFSEFPNNLIVSAADILVRVPEDEEFSELVARNARDPSKNAFHADLQLGGHDLSGIKLISAETGKIKNIGAGDFLLSGVEADRKNKNEIGEIRAGKVYFLDPGGNPLTIVRSDLQTGAFFAASVSDYGEPGAITAAKISARDFNMSDGRSGFTGPADWDIKTNAYLTNITLSVEKLNVSTFLDTSRGQDVFLSETDASQLEYASGSGIRAGVVRVDNIVLRSSISSEILAGIAGAPLIEIRPAGTSMLPDVLVAGIANDSLIIPSDPAGNDGENESCRSVITRAGGKYDGQSLANSIVCQFVMYNRIERRLEIKKCLMSGGSNCG